MTDQAEGRRELHLIALRGVGAELTRAKALRDATIRAAARDGLTLREIGAAVGVSHTRVGQIVGK